MRLVTVMHANDLKDDCIQWFPVCLTPPALGDIVLNTNTQTNDNGLASLCHVSE